MGRIVECQWLTRDGGIRNVSGYGERTGAARGSPSWFWVVVNGSPRCNPARYRPIIRYRVRQPSGIAILKRIAADPIKERIDA